MIATKPTAASARFLRAMHYLDRAHAQREVADRVGGKTGDVLRRLADKLSDDAMAMIVGKPR